MVSKVVSKLVSKLVSRRFTYADGLAATCGTNRFHSTDLRFGISDLAVNGSVGRVRGRRNGSEAPRPDHLGRIFGGEAEAFEPVVLFAHQSRQVHDV